MSNLVEISHPGQDGSEVATCTRQAFDKLWSRKGFEIVGEITDPDAADEPAADAPDPFELKGQALEDALHDAGLPSTGTADDKRAALAAHNASQGA